MRTPSKCRTLRSKFVLLLVCLTSTTLVAPATASDFHSPTEQARLIRGAMTFLVSQQELAGNEPLSWRGEFPSYMENRKDIIALGKKGKRSRDSNCFTTALIHEELAPHLDRLKDAPGFTNLLNLTFENVMTFRQGESFNFWHALPRDEKMKEKTPKKLRDQATFRPNQYELTNRFSLVRANIANDADDTALAYLAMAQQSDLAGKSGLIDRPRDMPSKIAQVFAPYRDTGEREARYPSNVLYGNFRNTGAFLTWLSEERTPFMLSVLKSWKGDLRIPEGVNNTDCVVNANVLNALSKWDERDAPGYAEACHYIGRAVTKGIEKKCGIYYPNPYTLHYAVGKAMKAGASCFEASARVLLDRLLKEQLPEGSWEGGPFSEPIQSSLYATRAIFDLSEVLKERGKVGGAVEKAMNYLNSEKIEGPDGSVSWPEGSFFSGGGFVRRLLAWKSASYSTALGMTILIQYQEYLQSVRAPASSRP